MVSGFDWSTDIGESLKFGINGNMRLESDRRTSTPALLAVAAGTGNVTVPTAPGGGVNNYVKIPTGIQDGNIKINLRASIGSQDDRWALEFWGSNLTNEHTRNVTFNTPLRGVASLGGGGRGWRLARLVRAGAAHLWRHSACQILAAKVSPAE